jgi:hypothetical protein
MARIRFRGLCGRSDRKDYRLTIILVFHKHHGPLARPEFHQPARNPLGVEPKVTIPRDIRRRGEIEAGESGWMSLLHTTTGTGQSPGPTPSKHEIRGSGVALAPMVPALVSFAIPYVPGGENWTQLAHDFPTLRAPPPVKEAALRDRITDFSERRAIR